MVVGFDFFGFAIIMLAEVLLKSFFERNASHYQSVIKGKWRKIKL
jgi:hypothetical protein